MAWQPSRNAKSSESLSPSTPGQGAERDGAKEHDENIAGAVYNYKLMAPGTETERQKEHTQAIETDDGTDGTLIILVCVRELYLTPRVVHYVFIVPL